MNIFSCVDNNNIDKIFVLFYSCYINSSKKDELKFYLLVENEIDETFVIPDVFRDNLKIKNLDKDYLKENGWSYFIEEFSKYFYLDGHKCNHIMNFSRFFIFELFPELDRVIYLDWDMIVEKDIFTLQEQYNTDKLIVADANNFRFSRYGLVGNIINLTKEEYQKLFPSLAKIKIGCIKDTKNELKEIYLKYNNILKKITGYNDLKFNKSFNAGFFIVSKETFENDNLIKLINKLIIEQKENKTFRFGTQIIMNLISLKNIDFVDMRWNNKPSNNNYITHWNGLNKPWESNDELWINYLNLFKSHKIKENKLVSKTNKKGLSKRNLLLLSKLLLSKRN